MDNDCLVSSHIFRGRQNGLRETRGIMIREAIAWGKGTLDRPIRHEVNKLTDGTSVYFLKPGKETANVARPNPHDMTPMLGNSNEVLRFDQIWTQLSKISVIDFEAFKMVLTLIYRDAYLMDHTVVNGVVRYSPRGQVLDCIRRLDGKVGRVLPNGVEGMLFFLDILGWNEDVKYHTENDLPTFDGDYGSNVGRVNTLLTCIRVPYQTSLFVKDILDHSQDKLHIDFGHIYEVMQQFAKSRGTSTPTNAQLLEWLSPYLIE